MRVITAHSGRPSFDPMLEQKPTEESSADELDELDELTLPETVYGAVIADHFVDKEGFAWRRIKVYIPILLTTAIQGLMCWRSIQAHFGEDSCEDANKLGLLRIFCVGLFELVLLKHLKSKAEAYIWLWQFGTCEGHEAFELYVDEEGQQRPKSKMTLKAWRAFCAMLMPETLMILMLMIFGGSYVARSSKSESLMMNCLGLIFVLEIDDHLVAFLPSVTRRRLEKVRDEPFKLKRSEPTAVIRRLFTDCGFVFVGAMTSLQLRAWCHADLNSLTLGPLFCGAAISFVYIYLEHLSGA
mmetsp:Transcript_113243/g.283588  ORF Transcript_113243/g.283588 Transcript_113243/m.283588 type:complete len:298 (+) Transcript_113243:41-934(+)